MRTIRISHQLTYSQFLRQHHSGYRYSNFRNKFRFNPVYLLLGSVSFVTVNDQTQDKQKYTHDIANVNHNNRKIIQIQNTDTNHRNYMTEGNVKLTFMGHASFQIESPKGLKIIIDPWQNDQTGYWGCWFHKLYPKTQCDIALSTHNHFDHNAFDRIEASMILDRMTGTFEFGDVMIEGFADKHTLKGCTGLICDELGIEKYPPNNVSILDNTMFVITSGGVRILIWGDNRADVPDNIYEKIVSEQGIDVVIIPIDDSYHLLTEEETFEILDTLNPKIVIPCHYLTNGCGSCLSTLHSADEWVKRFEGNGGNVEILDTHTRVLKCTDIDVEYLENDIKGKNKGYKVVYFGQNLPFDPMDLEVASMQ